MIQRKQTLYLLIGIVFILSYGLGNPQMATIKGAFQDSGSQSVAHVMLNHILVFSQTTLNAEPDFTVSNAFVVYTLIVIGALSFIALFLFKKRALQLRLVSYLLIFDVLLYFMLFFQISMMKKLFVDPATTWSFYMATLLLLPLLHFLALRGIIHDIKLLKSVDRLR